jgi:hypothetical protein
MSAILNSLKFVTAKRPAQIPAVQVRRNKLSNKLYDQIRLATSLRDGTTYMPIHLRSVRDRDTGELKRIEQPKRIRQWWFTNDNGRVCVQIKYGSKTLDIGGKGKNSVEVASGDELIKVLELIKSAVEAGELDGQLESAGLKLKEGFSAK